MVRFRAVIEKAGDADNGWWIVTLPPEANDKLGKARRVRGTINGIAFAGALMFLGGGVRALNPRKQNCADAGVTLGDTVEVALEKDPDANTIVIPEELTRVLATQPQLEQLFATFSTAHRREYAEWIGSAKRAQTRSSRAEKALAMISAKQRV